MLYDGQKGRAEPQVPWAEPFLGNETKDLKQNGKALRMTMAQIKDQKGGLGAAWHSLQEITECEIHKDNSTSGFRHFYHDGKFFLSQNLKTQQIVPSFSRAKEIRKILITEAMTHASPVLADCVHKLQRHLESKMGFRRAVPPTVNVTHSQVLDGYMGHGRNQSTDTGNARRPWSRWLAILCALIFASPMVYFFWLKKRTSAAGGPDLVSLHVLDQGQVVTGAHEGTTQLGLQALLLAPGATGHAEGTQTLQPGGLASPP
ncbi:MHC class I polypeptide-related sequence A-like [Nycticebus coucang]|uniref:MHC class I polypeptide-related sequence A-like n=1 Tax=Nycticebus coucang TaxID=9470 RepID=UPI00234DA0D9|nr:MHC class I polypeptide-related sequence A-like [Nycticebus coucang]